MLFFKIIAIAFVAVSLYEVVKQTKVEYAPFVLICSGIIIIIALADYMMEAITVFKSLADKSHIDSSIFSTLLRIIAIGYVCEYSSSICEDSGCTSLAKKIQLGGKLTIFVMAMPIISNIITIIEGII